MPTRYLVGHYALRDMAKALGLSGRKLRSLTIRADMEGAVEVQAVEVMTDEQGKQLCRLLEGAIALRPIGSEDEPTPEPAPAPTSAYLPLL